MLGGLLFSVINPEIAAGHSNYARNYHLLTLVKLMSLLASGVVVLILWLLACFTGDSIQGAILVVAVFRGIGAPRVRHSGGAERQSARGNRPVYIVRA